MKKIVGRRSSPPPIQLGAQDRRPTKLPPLKGDLGGCRFAVPLRHGLLSTCLLLLLTSCAPKVQLSTPEPLKVDIEMTVNVYQREIASQTKKVSEVELQALRRAESRAGEIWAMKNDGVVIETETGYLQSQNRSGWDPVYVNRIVAEENRDRRIKYESEARDTEVPIETVQALAGKRLREQAYVTRTNTVQSVTIPDVPPPPPPKAK